MLLVVLTHAGIGALPGGYVGVDVFFVLSGFLITGLLLAEARATGSVSLIGFYVRRARRILPAAALTLLATDLAAALFLNFVRAKQAVDDSFFAAAFSANFRFAARGVDYFAQSQPPSPVLHYWSLAIEEQFYLVWPLLLSLVLFGAAVKLGRPRFSSRHDGRLLLVLSVLIAASLIWSVHLTAAQPETAYYSPFARAWELGLGAAIAAGASVLSRVSAGGRLVIGWVGLLAILTAALVYSDQTPFPGAAALVPTIGAALVIIAGFGARHSPLAVGRMLSLRPMGIVGDRSYALYLWHWPVLILASQALGEKLPILMNIGLIVCAFLLSCISYALFENPIRRRIRGRRATAAIVAACMAAFLGAAALSQAAIEKERRRFEAPLASVPAVSMAPIAFTHRALGANEALPEVVAAVRAAERGARIPSPLEPPISQITEFPAADKPADECISHAVSHKNTSAVCRMGRPASRRLIVLIGDSHAMNWLPAVLGIARHDGWAVVPLLRLGCRPDRWIDDTACTGWLRWATQEVARLHPQVILVGGHVGQGQSPTAAAAVQGTVSAANALKRFGAVAVIGDPEGLDLNPIDCLLSGRATMATCTTTWPAVSLSAYDRVAAAAKQFGFGFLRTRGLLCSERRCPAVIGHTIAYVDDNHVSPTYAAHVAGAFRAAFLRAVPTKARRLARASG